MGQICEIIAGLEHFGIHERRKRCFALAVELLQCNERGLYGFRLGWHVSVLSTSG
jgi:hypothetical protein